MVSIPREKILERWNDLSDLLREAIYSPFYNEEIENVAEEFHLSDRKEQDLAYLCLLVFSGFVHLQDFYKEIRERLGVDNRIALDIYQRLDQKIFSPLKREIEANYLQHKVGVVPESRIEQPQATEQKVVLAPQDKHALNLRGAAPVASQAPIRILGREEEKEPSVQTFSSQSISSQPISYLKPEEQAPKPQPSLPPKTEPQESQGPMVIHQKEGSSSISQTKPLQGYQHMSFGGFFGSKRDGGSSTPQAYRATIETPGQAQPSPTPSVPPVRSDRIPVSIKQKEEKPKTVHYSAMRTTLPAEKKEAVSEQKKEEGFVDLANLTIKK